MSQDQNNFSSERYCGKNFNNKSKASKSSDIFSVFYPYNLCFIPTPLSLTVNLQSSSFFLSEFKVTFTEFVFIIRREKIVQVNYGKRFIKQKQKQLGASFL